MPDLQSQTQTPLTLDNRLVAMISSVLTSAGIPNVLWGNYLLTIYGVPTIVDGMAFVVPDEYKETALSSIEKAGFAPCIQGQNCPFWIGQRRQPSAGHLHLNDELAISVYLKSDVLWELSFTEGSPGLLKASDERLPPAIPGRGQGRFPLKLDLVQIPHPVRYCEAVIALLCRGYETRAATYWMAILTYILEYVDGLDIFDGNSLKEAYRPFYHALKAGEYSRMYLLLDELRRHLALRESDYHSVNSRSGPEFAKEIWD
ncbi:uncharacterized protein N7459_004555 [Penicillium hispanicum]|uniref:uncharacterized protein n=1 Tax=Penicillium hispanicum TaxID=1080232 RepID=UPI0025407D73|nr:uncharacterized protein N7459_004555 [Penicillium hispanicum]KAJ5584755.1 hypothetical protein N7459_004555 [Penicillium hispanicum]